MVRESFRVAIRSSHAHFVLAKVFLSLLGQGLLHKHHQHALKKQPNGIGVDRLIRNDFVEHVRSQHSSNSITHIQTVHKHNSIEFVAQTNEKASRVD
jgi:hypothetical protein